MFGDRNHIGASDLGDGDAAVGLVGRVEIDMVRSNTCSDCKLELLGLFQALSGKVTGMETISLVSRGERKESWLSAGE